MDPKKIINFRELSYRVTGNREIIRSNRANPKYTGEIEELLNYVEGWVFRNSKLKEADVTIKTK